MAGESQETPGSRPDPTVLTTEQLLREIATLTDLFDARLKGQADLCDEKFRSVGTQFGLVERQRVEQKNDTKAAVDAALAAAKEAVKEQTTAFGLATAKSETAVGEQLKQLTVTFNTGVGSVLGQVSDLKTRVERIENLKAGGQQVGAQVLAVASLLVALIAVAVTVIVATSR